MHLSQSVPPDSQTVWKVSQAGTGRYVLDTDVGVLLHVYSLTTAPFSHECPSLSRAEIGSSGQGNEIFLIRYPSISEFFIIWFDSPGLAANAPALLPSVDHEDPIVDAVSCQDNVYRRSAPTL